MKSRYDDLRAMREGKWKATQETAEPATKTPVKRRGRPRIGDKPMTAAERMRRRRRGLHGDAHAWSCRIRFLLCLAACRSAQAGAAEPTCRAGERGCTRSASS